MDTWATGMEHVLEQIKEHSFSWSDAIHNTTNNHSLFKYILIQLPPSVSLVIAASYTPVGGC